MTNEIPFGQRITDGWNKLIEHLNKLHLTEEEVSRLTDSIAALRWENDDEC